MFFFSKHKIIRYNVNGSHWSTEPNPFTPQRFSRQRESRDFEQSANRSRITSFYPSPSVHTLYIGHFLLFDVYFIVFGDFLLFLDEEISVKIVFELHFFFEILVSKKMNKEICSRRYQINFKPLRKRIKCLKVCLWAKTIIQLRESFPYLFPRSDSGEFGFISTGLHLDW